ncbi:MAG TPA: quinate 5-dehydrogenase [Clostridia bacterium]|nr:quinate 5-dehydrogenase [Clostridia bacterium]
MKRVLGISIGSSARNHTAEIEILGERVLLERIGTDGDIKKAAQLISEYDGKVDCFGMGGIDICLNAYGEKKYMLHAAAPLVKAAKLTPIVDGTGLKNTLERRVVYYINNELGIPVKGKKVFMTCALDRFGMTQSFEELGADVCCGDLMYGLGIPIPLTHKRLNSLAKVLFPIISHLPFSMLYPTGEKQNERVPKYEKYYYQADFIAGDFMYIIKHMPENMDGKIVVTNTVTERDMEELQRKRVKTVITSTPAVNGRIFGTNMIEAAFVAVIGKKPEEIKPEDYNDLLDKIGNIHSVRELN